MTPISILTIVHDRLPALINMLHGLELSTHLPDEVVVIFMNEDISELPTTQFPVRTARIDRHGFLPLAEARNLAAEQASFEHLIFLDVDCIPSTDLVAQYLQTAALPETLWTGLVRYLRKGATEASDLFSSLNEVSDADPIRQVDEEITYELFWSLNFGCTKTTFKRIGGFDTAFTGYGGEDTDFAFSAREKGVPIHWLDAVAYHQYHPSYAPPLNHLEDIIKNAAIFRSKWGVWPMTGWLKKFLDGGYINWKQDHIDLKVLPTAKEIEACLKV
ncbi:hypothetical protein INP83_11305 [Mucilaginibacter sp. 21P]|uniref:glycosyltransferase family 2 protein n=1 Tax=Mucilaginibacter sp. 21P TaxID=2778902 RepID=UPI001C577725|nr:galactosyltransferase-related protein [Mucilaginibacter sp. 21P]QXV63698.1 hypothetical protein INP83_11305 [Mucilaginibacter sp. 21P]